MAKTSYVGKAAWDRYTKILNDFMEVDAAKKKVLWKRYIDVPTLYGEDSRTPPFVEIELEVLFSYNPFRTWPTNIATASGELDMNNIVLYVSKNYLKENGYLNSNGYFEFDRARDRFILDGMVFKSSGDTSVSQAGDHDILVMVILKREEVENMDRET